MLIVNFFILKIIYEFKIFTINIVRKQIIKQHFKVIMKICIILHNKGRDVSLDKVWKEKNNIDDLKFKFYIFYVDQFLIYVYGSTLMLTYALN